MSGDRDLDTICAVSTPAGRGGISVIRISGSHALSMTRKSCGFLPTNPESHKAYFGTLTDSQNQGAIDEVLLTYFQKGRSFTGEETCEISCHGSPIIAERILQSLVAVGARLADRGEFTYRAFMSGNIDLVQAESVLSLIESKSSVSAKMALRQLKGGLSEELTQIESDLTWLLAHQEADIDFSTEGLQLISNEEILRRTRKIHQDIQSLVQSFKVGRVLQNGLRVVLSGRPNVGKSSLLNNILKSNRAIVTEIAGTTRDLVEDTLSVDGVNVTITDTAGLRSTHDVVEKMGIQKSYEALNDSDLVCYVIDLTEGASEEDYAEIKKIDPSRLFILFNKADQVNQAEEVAQKLLISMSERMKTVKFLQNPGFFDKTQKLQGIFVSALDKKTSEIIKTVIRQQLDLSSLESTPLVSQARHFECLSRAQDCLLRAEMLAKQSVSPEFLSLELKEALIAVQETLGKRFDDEIMDRVFKEFCIGK